MAFTATTNYALQKPTVGTEKDAWGDDMNVNLDTIDTQIKARADAIAANTAALALKAPITSPAFFGIPTAPTAATGTNTLQIASTAFVQANMILAGAFYAPLKTREIRNYGFSITLAAVDAGKIVEVSNASAVTVTIPTNAAVPFDLDTFIDIIQLGAGLLTILHPGVTLRSLSGKFTSAGQYSRLLLNKRNTDDWHLSGDLA